MDLRGVRVSCCKRCVDDRTKNILCETIRNKIVCGINNGMRCKKNYIKIDFFIS